MLRKKKLTKHLRKLGFVIAIILFFVSGYVITNSLKHQQEINKFIEQGHEKEVNIIECLKETSFFLLGHHYKVKISFFTKPILQGGEFKLYKITKYINTRLFKELQTLKKANILYLNLDSHHSIIFKKAVEKKYFSALERIDYGIVLLFTSLILYGAIRISKAKN